jgi:AraC-like DNA-binding protein
LLNESSALITISQFSNLYRLIASELDDELPGMFSRRVRGGTLKLTCLSMLEASSLRVALYRLSRFLRVVVDEFVVDVTVECDIVRVDLIPAAESVCNRIFSQEILLKVIHGVTSWLAGKKLPLEKADFCYPEPLHVETYTYLFPGPARFDQAQTALYFRVKDLDAPIRRNKRTLNEFLVRAPADWLFVSSAERVVSHRVREFLESRLEEPIPIDEVADKLHCSIRTLSRWLHAEGTSFQTIKDEMRRDMAIQLLTKSDMAVALIGSKVGFEDATIFYRAFKKWTGSTPGAYRTK